MKTNETKKGTKNWLKRKNRNYLNKYQYQSWFWRKMNELINDNCDFDNDNDLVENNYVIYNDFNDFDNEIIETIEEIENEKIIKKINNLENDSKDKSFNTSINKKLLKTCINNDLEQFIETINELKDLKNKKKEINVDFQDKDWYTPLLWACINWNYNISKILIEIFNADVFINNKSNQNAYKIAKIKGYQDICNLIEMNYIN